MAGRIAASYPPPLPPQSLSAGLRLATAASPRRPRGRSGRATATPVGRPSPSTVPVCFPLSPPLPSYLSPRCVLFSSHHAHMALVDVGRLDRESSPSPQLYRSPTRAAARCGRTPSPPVVRRGCEPFHVAGGAALAAAAGGDAVGSGRCSRGRWVGECHHVRWGSWHPRRACAPPCVGPFLCARPRGE